MWTTRGQVIKIHGMKAYPLKFQPIYKRRIWGGTKLREMFGKDIPAGEKIGESWELADLPEDKSATRTADKSVIANGELAGRTIGWAIGKYPKEIMGGKDFSRPFPLLIKFLDAEDVLSVQVHPDEEACRRLGKGEPKSECWYIIAAAPGAVIYKGLKKGVTKEKFAEAIKRGNVAEMLVKLPVKAGECHYLPAGTAHSIGAGILLAEIQTPSDTTYRVFDWNRVDESGKARELHIEEALESIHFGTSGDELAVTTAGRLVDCEFFKVDKGHQGKGSEIFFAPGEMKTLIIISGRGVIAGTEAKAVEFKAGETILVPAAYEGAMRFSEKTEYLTVTT
ncbi:MAG: class I mannose-6-phosphate isomerase [Sedimentisphaerales bacterium]|nr:class I mannose-6-phosphate isomerase [Sedimentisphaerales bacterium]